MTPGAAAVIVVTAVVLGVAVPWLATRMLVPALVARGGGVANYRGRIVSPGLGTVWFVWSGCAVFGGAIATAMDAENALPILALAGPLALVAFAAGLIDDSFGSSADKGFRGHLRALTSGRLTTGGMKLIAIGLASLAVAFVIGGVAPWSSAVIDLESAGDLAGFVALCLVAGAATALTSNLVNLTDLRPGRALKAYAVLTLFGIAVLTSSAIYRGAGVSAEFSVRAVDLVVLGLFGMGPVIAVWRYDLDEVAMLGDSGANPMGAVAGLLIVAGLPMWGLLAYAVVVFGLNLMSERVSFSRVIDSTPALRWFDRLGRLADTRADAEQAEISVPRPPGAEVESSGVTDLVDKGRLSR